MCKIWLLDSPAPPTAPRRPRLGMSDSYATDHGWLGQLIAADRCGPGSAGRRWCGARRLASCPAPPPQRLTALYDETLAPSGLRSTQFAILAEIVDRDEGPPTLNQLADDLVLDRSGLGHSLRPLEREGLIRLEKSSADRRSTLVALTDQGRERYAYAFTLWQKAQDRYASVIGEAQANELRQRLLEIGHDDQLT